MLKMNYLKYQLEWIFKDKEHNFLAITQFQRIIIPRNIQKTAIFIDVNLLTDH